MSDKDDDEDSDDFIEIIEPESSADKGARTESEPKEAVNVISYTCAQCQSKFNSIQNLKDHVCSEHEKQLLEVNKSKPVSTDDNDKDVAPDEVSSNSKVTISSR